MKYIEINVISGGACSSNPVSHLIWVYKQSILWQTPPASRGGRYTGINVTTVRLYDVRDAENTDGISHKNIQFNVMEFVKVWMN